MAYYSIKTKDASTVTKILAKDIDIELDGLNVLQESMVRGQRFFIVLGGDKPAWDTGLIGIGEISCEPYDVGYSGKNYKVKMNVLLLLERALKRADFLPYRDTYGTIGIAPITKWEPNQALSQVPEKNAIALMRAMLELCPESKNEFDEILNISEKGKVYSSTTMMVEVPMNYGEKSREAIINMLENEKHTDKTNNIFLKNREPRKSKLFPVNQIIYGAPGTGKTYSTVEYALAIIENRPVDLSAKSIEQRKIIVNKYKEYVKNKQIVFTTFHQNYGYEEFIQGLRPDKDSETMSFKTVDGVFKNIADSALNDTEGKNFVIIIDEINRANISKVFGELITLIEEDKRWGELNEASATLQSGDVFAVPNNLYIVGTMNSADKSISLIDAALRRRFDFIEQKPDASLVSDTVLRSLLENLNLSLVNELDSTDLLIGHSYFMNKSKDDLCVILNNNIIPLLYEYFYDNRKKVAMILQDAIEKAGASISIIDEKVGRLKVKENGDVNGTE